MRNLSLYQNNYFHLEQHHLQHNAGSRELPHGCGSRSGRGQLPRHRQVRPIISFVSIIIVVTSFMSLCVFQVFVFVHREGATV